MDERARGFVLSVLCVVAIVAAAVVLIRLRLRVGRLQSAPSRGRGDSAGHEANPREFDDTSDDGGDGDGGDA